MVKRKQKVRDPDADLDKEMEEYDVSGSEDGLGEEEMVMLERAKHGRYIQDDSEEEVLKVYESSESSDGADANFGGGLGSDYDSDLEGGEEDDGLPSRQAWGSTKAKYYHTDYVDQDYGGLGKDEEEAALMEEEEARVVQRKLMEGLEENDFTMGLLDEVEEKKILLSMKNEEDLDAEKIQTDLSTLSKEEKIQFLKQESPELFLLIKDFKIRVQFVKDKIQPMLQLIKEGRISNCKSSRCLELFQHIILNYCTNITFYLVLKSRRIPVNNHPVVKWLVKARELLGEMDKLYEENIWHQVDEILALKEMGESFTPSRPTPSQDLQGNRAQRRNKKLSILQELKIFEVEIEKKKRKLETFKDNIVNTYMLNMSEDESEDSAQESDSKTKPEKKLRIIDELEENPSEEEVEDKKEGGEEDGEKRGITYTMSKNKGLTVKKRKDLKNPRVKHRNKYRKAKLRRKGQVREVRKETEKYGGEVSGIKAYISKSIKLK